MDINMVNDWSKVWFGLMLFKVALNVLNINYQKWNRLFSSILNVKDDGC